MEKIIATPARSPFFIILVFFIFPAMPEEMVEKNRTIDLTTVNRIFLYNLFLGDETKIDSCLALANQGLKKFVFISLEKQELFLIELADTFQLKIQTKISSGLKPGSTPTGYFTISKKKLARPSKKYGGVMTYWNCLTPDEAIGIHGLRDVSYEKNLGKPVSHGCIRIGKDIEKKFYELTPIGTVVLIE